MFTLAPKVGIFYILGALPRRAQVMTRSQGPRPPLASQGPHAQTRGARPSPNKAQTTETGSAPQTQTMAWCMVCTRKTAHQPVQGMILNRTQVPEPLSFACARRLHAPVHGEAAYPFYTWNFAMPCEPKTAYKLKI